jgi:hypothetical protein
MTQTTFDYEAGRAAPNIKTLNGMVFTLLCAGDWWMPHEICANFKGWMGVMASESSITARLRDLRKPLYGSHIIEKRRRENSTAFEYRLNDRRAV